MQKMCQVFRDARETATADSLNYYLVSYQQDPPPQLPIEMVLSDIDRLFKVNRVANALDIVGEFNFFSSTATEAIAKIEKLSKLVASANLSIKVIFSQKPSRKKSLKGGGWP